MALIWSALSGALTNGPDAPSAGEEFEAEPGTFANKLGPRMALSATSRASISRNKMKNVRRRWRFGGNVCTGVLTGSGCENLWVGDEGEEVICAVEVARWYSAAGMGRGGMTHPGPFCSGNDVCRGNFIGLVFMDWAVAHEELVWVECPGGWSGGEGLCGCWFWFVIRTFTLLFFSLFFFKA